MDRVNQIYNNELYQEILNKIADYEADRIFCKHTIEHFMDVARLMYITSLENDHHIDKSIIYATALMHDIGRARQYANGAPHEVESAMLCDLILPACGYSREEINQIKVAILGHRGTEASPDELGELLRVCDKKSRACYCCKAREKCNWPEDKMNLEIS